MGIADERIVFAGKGCDRSYSRTMTGTAGTGEAGRVGMQRQVILVFQQQYELLFFSWIFRLRRRFPSGCFKLAKRAFSKRFDNRIAISFWPGSCAGKADFCVKGMFSSSVRWM